MAWTKHGHQIPNTIFEMPRPTSVARCGGPGLCKQCSQEASAAQNAMEQSAKEIEENPLVAHARRELEAINEDPDTIEGYLNVVRAFTAMGHSGASAFIAIEVLRELLLFKPLSDLTDDPDEWYYHGPDVWGQAGGIWQNRRNGEAFSEDGGKTYYLLSERSANGWDLEVTPRHESKHVDK